MTAELTEAEYREHADQMDGFCTECNEVTRYGDTEPDAREYKCPDCHQFTCVGMEEAVLEEYIILTE